MLFLIALELVSHELFLFCLLSLLLPPKGIFTFLLHINIKKVVTIMSVDFKKIRLDCANDFKSKVVRNDSNDPYPEMIDLVVDLA